MHGIALNAALKESGQVFTEKLPQASWDTNKKEGREFSHPHGGMHGVCKGNATSFSFLIYVYAHLYVEWVRKESSNLFPVNEVHHGRFYGLCSTLLLRLSGLAFHRVSNTTLFFWMFCFSGVPSLKILMVGATQYCYLAFYPYLSWTENEIHHSRHLSLMHLKLLMTQTSPLCSEFDLQDQIIFLKFQKIALFLLSPIWTMLCYHGVIGTAMFSDSSTSLSRKGFQPFFISQRTDKALRSSRHTTFFFQMDKDLIILPFKKLNVTNLWISGGETQKNISLCKSK